MSSSCKFGRSADRMHRYTRLPKPEPWSAALNPGNNRDPDKNATPDYDPLGDWITQCHAAGIELHAWVNPFRVDRIVRDGNDKPLALLASDDFNTLYLDYTQSNVQDYVIDAIADLLTYRTRRTATVSTPGGDNVRAMKGGDGIDGLMFDHNITSKNLHHGTSQPAAAMLSASLRLSQHQQRVRWLASQCAAPAGPKSLDDFIERVFQTVYREHKLKFGFSPDRKGTHCMEWLKNGLVNYMIPETYFKGEPGDLRKELDKWLACVHAQRGFTPIVVAGLFTTRTQTPGNDRDPPWSGKVIADQIEESRRKPTRNIPPPSGQAHYSWSALRAPCCGGPIDAQDPQNTLGVLLKNKLYPQPALVPNCTTMPYDKSPAGPLVSLSNGTARWQLPRDSNIQVHFWSVWLHDSSARSRGWTNMMVLDKTVTELTVRNTVDRVAVKAVDRHNRESARGLSSR